MNTQFEFVPPGPSSDPPGTHTNPLVLHYCDGDTIIDFTIDEPDSLLTINETSLQDDQRQGALALMVGDRNAEVRWTANNIEFNLFRTYYHHYAPGPTGPSYLRIRVPTTPGSMESLFAAVHKARDYWQAYRGEGYRTGSTAGRRHMLSSSSSSGSP